MQHLVMWGLYCKILYEIFQGGSVKTREVEKQGPQVEIDSKDKIIFVEA